MVTFSLSFPLSLNQVVTLLTAFKDYGKLTYKRKNTLNVKKVACIPNLQALYITIP